MFDNDGNVIYPEEAVPDTGADESEEKAVVDDIPEEKPETTVPVEDTPAEKEAEAEVDENEFPTAEELPATIAYGKLKTLMNIREMPDTGAEVVTVYKRNTLIEIVEFCAGWLKIKCPEAVSGLATFLTVRIPMPSQPARSILWFPVIISGRSQKGNWGVAAAVQISVC